MQHLDAYASFFDLDYEHKEYFYDRAKSKETKLDEEFDLLHQISKSLQPDLPKYYDRAKANAWIRKLVNLKDTCQWPLRNEYAKLLILALQRQNLVGPFSNYPEEEDALPPLPEGLTLQQIAKQMFQEHKEGGDGPPVRADVSPDLTTYAAVQEIPGFGVHCFFAVSRKESLEKWLNVENAFVPIHKSIMEKKIGGAYANLETESREPEETNAYDSNESINVFEKAIYDLSLNRQDIADLEEWSKEIDQLASAALHPNQPTPEQMTNEEVVAVNKQDRLSYAGLPPSPKIRISDPVSDQVMDAIQEMFNDHQRLSHTVLPSSPKIQKSEPLTDQEIAAMEERMKELRRLALTGLPPSSPRPILSPTSIKPSRETPANIFPPASLGYQGLPLAYSSSPKFPLASPCYQGYQYAPTSSPSSFSLRLSPKLQADRKLSPKITISPKLSPTVEPVKRPRLPGYPDMSLSGLSLFLSSSGETSSEFLDNPPLPPKIRTSPPSSPKIRIIPPSSPGTSPEPPEKSFLFLSSSGETSSEFLDSPPLPPKVRTSPPSSPKIRIIPPSSPGTSPELLEKSFYDSYGTSDFSGESVYSAGLSPKDRENRRQVKHNIYYDFSSMPEQNPLLHKFVRNPKAYQKILENKDNWSDDSDEEWYPKAPPSQLRQSDIMAQIEQQVMSPSLRISPPSSPEIRISSPFRRGKITRTYPKDQGNQGSQTKITKSTISITKKMEVTEEENDQFNSSEMMHSSPPTMVSSSPQAMPQHQHISRLTIVKEQEMEEEDDQYPSPEKMLAGTPEATRSLRPTHSPYSPNLLPPPVEGAVLSPPIRVYEVNEPRLSFEPELLIEPELSIDPLYLSSPPSLLISEAELSTSISRTSPIGSRLSPHLATTPRVSPRTSQSPRNINQRHTNASPTLSATAPTSPGLSPIQRSPLPAESERISRYRQLSPTMPTTAPINSTLLGTVNDLDSSFYSDWSAVTVTSDSDKTPPPLNMRKIDFESLPPQDSFTRNQFVLNPLPLEELGQLVFVPNSEGLAQMNRTFDVKRENVEENAMDRTHEVPASQFSPRRLPVVTDGANRSYGTPTGAMDNTYEVPASQLSPGRLPVVRVEHRSYEVTTEALDRTYEAPASQFSPRRLPVVTDGANRSYAAPSGALDNTYEVPASQFSPKRLPTVADKRHPSYVDRNEDVNCTYEVPISQLSPRRLPVVTEGRNRSNMATEKSSSQIFETNLPTSPGLSPIRLSPITLSPNSLSPISADGRRVSRYRQLSYTMPSTAPINSTLLGTVNDLDSSFYSGWAAVTVTSDTDITPPPLNMTQIDFESLPPQDSFTSNQFVVNPIPLEKIGQLVFVPNSEGIAQMNRTFDVKRENVENVMDRTHEVPASKFSPRRLPVVTDGGNRSYGTPTGAMDNTYEVPASQLSPGRLPVVIVEHCSSGVTTDALDRTYEAPASQFSPRRLPVVTDGANRSYAAPTGALDNTYDVPASRLSPRRLPVVTDGENRAYAAPTGALDNTYDVPVSRLSPRRLPVVTDGANRSYAAPTGAMDNTYEVPASQLSPGRLPVVIVEHCSNGVTTDALDRTYEAPASQFSPRRLPVVTDGANRSYAAPTGALDNIYDVSASRLSPRRLPVVTDRANRAYTAPTGALDNTYEFPASQLSPRRLPVITDGSNRSYAASIGALDNTCKGPPSQFSPRGLQVDNSSFVSDWSDISVVSGGIRPLRNLTMIDFGTLPQQDSIIAYEFERPPENFSNAIFLPEEPAQKCDFANMSDDQADVEFEAAAELPEDLRDAFYRPAEEEVCQGDEFEANPDIVSCPFHDSQENQSLAERSAFSIPAEDLNFTQVIPPESVLLPSHHPRACFLMPDYNREQDDPEMSHNESTVHENIPLFRKSDIMPNLPRVIDDFIRKTF